MKIKIEFLVVLSLMLSQFACTLTPKTTEAPVSDTLQNSSWILRDIDGQPVLTIFDITLEFADTEVSGFGGCNRFQGSYTATSDLDLKVSSVIRTKKACQVANRSEKEDSLIGRLESAVTYNMDAETLIIKSDLGSLGLSRNPAQ